MNTRFKIVERIMPPITAVPTECRPSAPAPVATYNGMTPRMNATLVIKIGRSRSSEASIAASVMDRPWVRNCSANSTIRMEFLADRPMSMTKPIWT